MKRYLLFYGETYYPNGGWGDFRGSYVTAWDAVASIPSQFHSPDWPTGTPVEWWHVVDAADGRVVSDSRSKDGPTKPNP